MKSALAVAIMYGALALMPTIHQQSDPGSFWDWLYQMNPRIWSK